MKLPIVAATIKDRSLPAQCVLLGLAFLSTLFQIQSLWAWIFLASLFAGMVAFASGIISAIMLRRWRWLILSLCAVFVLLVSITLSVATGVTGYGV